MSDDIDCGDLLLPNGKVLIREAYKTTYAEDWSPAKGSFLPPLPIEEFDGSRPVGVKIYFNIPEFWRHCSEKDGWSKEELVPGYYIFNARGSLFRSISQGGDFKDWICICDKTIPKIMEYCDMQTGEQYRTVSSDDPNAKLPSWRSVTPEDRSLLGLPSWIAMVDENRL